MFWNKYPYTDFHELNLDMILDMMRELHKEWSEFEAVNKITNAGAWDITKQYQAWTVVSDNNAGYISLQPVPAGVAITNTDYWGLIADYDILITDLSNRISTLEGQMVTANSNILSLQTLTAQLNNRQGVANDFAGKSVLIIGDSIGDETIANLQPNYVVHLRQALQTLGATVTNDSVGGRCIASGYTTAGGIQEAIAGISGTYDIVIVELGINDWANQATQSAVYSAIQAFQTWIVTNMPAARVFWITPLSTVPDNTKIPVAYYRDIILYGASHNSYSIIDSYAESDSYNGTNNALVSMYTRSGDGIHPNPTYAPIYAGFILKRLLSGGGQINYNGVSSFNTPITVNSQLVVAYYRPGGRIQLAGGYNASYTPSGTVVNCGTLPDWARPYFLVFNHSFSGFDVVVRTDGVVYLVFNDGIRAYTDVSINVEYDCRNNQFVSIS